MFERQLLGLKEARAALDAMLKQASKEPERPIAAVVVDGYGDLVCMARMDGARPLNNDIAIRKAYTAARMSRDTRAYAELLQQMKMSNSDLGDNLTTVTGGVSIRKPGDEAGFVFGAIGVSGLTGDEDEALAFVGLKELQAICWK